MREYSTVSPLFWIGKTGKTLRGYKDGQLLASYLMTGPHAHMTGVYYCPVAYMVQDTGLTVEESSAALKRLIELDFCSYDYDCEWVFVHTMILWQLGRTVKPGDRRLVMVRRYVDSVPSEPLLALFRDRYTEFNTSGRVEEESRSRNRSRSTGALAIVNAPSKGHRRGIEGASRGLHEAEGGEEEIEDPAMGANESPNVPKEQPFSDWIPKAEEVTGRPDLVKFYVEELRRCLTDYYQARGGRLTPTRLGFIGQAFLRHGADPGMTAIEMFCDKHGGSKDERYLVGIARRLSKMSEQDQESELGRHRSMMDGRGLWHSMNER